MNDRKLFKETFSTMHVSEKTILEVIKMTHNNKKIIRLPRAVAGLAACLALVLGLAVTANAATGGELFDGLSVTIREVFRINDYKQILVGDDGLELTTLSADAKLIDRDGRAILVVGEDEVDITDALNQDGAYTYERTSGGTTCRVEVTGTLEDWTMKTAIFDEGKQPDVIITSTSGDNDITISDENGEAFVYSGPEDILALEREFGENNPLISGSAFSFGTPEN